MEPSTINYGSTFFEYPTPTKIHDKQTFESLNTIQNMSVNVQIMLSNEGGVQDGHLRLILNPNRYAFISNTWDFMNFMNEYWMSMQALRMKQMMIYNTLKPVNNIFSVIEDLIDYAEAGHVPNIYC